MRGRVVLERAERRRAAGAALVEDDDAVVAGIEEAAMGRGGAGARSAMQEHHRHAVGIAALLPIDRVLRVERQHAAGIGLDGREQILAGKWRVTIHHMTV